MPLDPSIPLAIRPAAIPQIPIANPVQQLGTALSLHQLMQQGQLTGIQLQQARLAMQEQQYTANLFAGAFGGRTPGAPAVPAPVPGVAPAPAPPVPAPVAPPPTPALLPYDPLTGAFTPAVPPAVAPIVPPAAAPPVVPTAPIVPGAPTAGLPPAPLMDRPLFGIPGYPTPRQIVTGAPRSGPGIIENINKAYKSQLDTELAQLNLHKANNEAVGSLLNGVTDDESMKRALVDAVRNGWMSGDDAGRFTSLGFKNPYVQKRLEELKQQSLSVDKAVSTAIAKNKENRDQLLFPSQLLEQTSKGQQAELQSALSVLAPTIERSPAEFGTKLGNTDPQAGPVYSPYVQSVLSGAKTSKDLAERGLTAQQSLQQDLEQRKFAFEQQKADPFNLFGLNPPAGAPAPTAVTAPPGTVPPAGAHQQIISGYTAEGEPIIALRPIQQTPAVAAGAVVQPIPSAQPAPSAQAAIRDPNLHGQALLDQLPPALAAQVKAISEGRQDFPNVRALATAPGQTLAALVAQYDPSFDVKNPAIRQATAKAFTSGEEASRVTALNNSVSLLNDLSLAADRLKNRWSPIYNTIGNFLNTQKGYGEVKDFDTAKAALLSQLPTAVKGDMKLWQDQISSSDSPEALHRVLARMANTIETNLNQLQQQERSGMGTTIDRPPLMSPSSRQTLDRVKNLAAGATAGKNPNPGGYTPGHVYGGLTYLGGDVNQRSSWK